MEFKDKVVIITGAAGGIGAGTVKAFVEQGAKVVLVDISKENLEKTAADLKLQEGRFLLIPTDVSKEDDVINYVRKTKEVFGRIDVFFNNAGIEGAIGEIAGYSTEMFNRVMNINVNGTFFGMKHVLEVMKEQKSGAIINASSCAGITGMPALSTYATSKFAITGMTRSAALENAPLGIRVNAVCPAYINTRMMRSIEEGVAGDGAAKIKDEWSETVPMKRYGEVEEVSNAVLFLASEKASFITGVLLPVDGGYVA